MRGFAREDGDLAVDEAGRLIDIDGLDLVDQDLELYLTLPYSSVDDVGSKLLPSVRGDSSTIPLSRQTVTQEITAVVERLQRAQTLEPYITENEAISHIEQLIVIVDDDNKTDILFSLDVRTQATQEVKKRKVFSQSIYNLPPSQSVRTRIGSR